MAAKNLVGGYKPQLLSAKDYDPTVEVNGSTTRLKAKYQNYLPTWDREKTYPALEPFEHHERGNDADRDFPDILKSGTTITDITPSIGSEVRGIQLSQLSDAGKDQLALLVAQRKVVAFRNQDFRDLPIPDALDYCRYFGPLNIHPTTGSPAGYPEVHLAHRGADDKTMDNIFSARTNSLAWHSDTTFEIQPAGTVFLYMLEQPEVGGDTLFADTASAYERLSPAFKQRLHGLSVVHSAHELAASSRARGGIVRREPVANVHPLIRTHPVTGKKSIFVNPHYSGQIIGFKKEESDMLLKYLCDHIAYCADSHARVRWEDGTVVVFDNRNTCHTALFDWTNGDRRHLARITPQAEKPFETPFVE